VEKETLGKGTLERIMTEIRDAGYVCSMKKRRGVS
jgi:hypothetical protein